MVFKYTVRCVFLEGLLSNDIIWDTLAPEHNVCAPSNQHNKYNTYVMECSTKYIHTDDA